MLGQGIAQLRAFIKVFMGLGAVDIAERLTYDYRPPKTPKWAGHMGNIG